MAESYIDILTIGVTVSADIAQYQPVQATGAAATAAGNAVGFAKTAIANGKLGPVQVSGVAIAIAGASIAVGDPVKVHTTVTQVVPQGGSGTIIGRALNAASSGDQVRVLIIPN